MRRCARHGQVTDSSAPALDVLGLERIGLGLGRMPGDFAYRGRNVQVWFPLGTSVVVSLLLSGLLYLLSRMRH